MTSMWNSDLSHSVTYIYLFIIRKYRSWVWMRPVQLAYIHFIISTGRTKNKFSAASTLGKSQSEFLYHSECNLFSHVLFRHCCYARVYDCMKYHCKHKELPLNVTHTRFSVAFPRLLCTKSQNAAAERNGWVWNVSVRRTHCGNSDTI